MAASVSKARLLDLARTQCNIFGTTFNPNRIRMGNSVLRERLKGPALAAYYPRNSVTIADIQKEFKRYDMETWNEEEEDRLEGLQIAKLRGKGAPKKKREANTSKKGRKKK
ncbi:mitochondral 37S ribosomal protein S27 [Knufia obscura]|uniref:Small ribosomal subunit protein mS33 n=2 Tax=Knufia TaxID=430999 RepID=A0AAN8ELI0_9EURO|nr:mitochondral 37S ribosomal protein S27 [Knufia obscura]KAK5954068.1 mitochondral 37S ribosomal protein S27 [Knufia fluminis]